MELKKGQAMIKKDVSHKGKVTGHVEVLGFKEDQEGLDLAKTTLTIKDVKDLNRQRVTDNMNSIRVEYTVKPATKAKKLYKDNTGFKEKMDKLLAEFGQ